MLTIRILEPVVTTREGVKNGRAWKMRLQEAVLDKGEFDRTKFMLTLGDMDPPYSPGVYTLSSDAVKVGERGDLEFVRRPKLVPAVPASKVAAAPAQPASVVR